MYAENLIKLIAKKHDVDLSKYDMNELVMGMDVELEHGSQNPVTDITNDEPEMTFKIVLAHMDEDPKYYTKLEKMENKKEQLDESAKRMMELAGLSENEIKKQLTNEAFGSGKKVLKEAHPNMHLDDLAAKIEKTKAGEKSKEETNEEFDIHEFEQKEVEKDDDHEELYTMESINESEQVVDLGFLFESSAVKEETLDEKKYSDAAQSFISAKIKHLMDKEGKEHDQAIAMAINMARDKGMKVPDEK